MIAEIYRSGRGRFASGPEVAGNDDAEDLDGDDEGDDADPAIGFPRWRGARPALMLPAGVADHDLTADCEGAIGLGGGNADKAIAARLRYEHGIADEGEAEDDDHDIEDEGEEGAEGPRGHAEYGAEVDGHDELVA